MRTGRLAGVGAVLLVLAAPAAARELAVTAHDDGGRYWFEVEGLTGRNPYIQLTPGENVTVHVRNEGDVAHDLHFDLAHAASRLLAPGESGTFSFQVPPGFEETDYYCHPHASLGMAGKAGAAASKKSPGLLVPGLAAGLLLAALAARRRAA